MRQRNDANVTLLSGTSYADPGDKMVMVKALGNERCRAPWPEKGHRRAGPPISCDHAPHVERWHGVPLDQGACSSRRLRGRPRRCADQTGDLIAASRWRDVPRGTMDE